LTKIRTVLFTSSLALASVVVAGMPAPAFAQDAFTRARYLYESAEYEQALVVLSTLKDKATPEADAYQVFCLVALGRQDEARGVVQALVRKDPWFRPVDTEVSPRLRLFFDDVRRPLLPEVARTAYLRAKATYDRKDFATARGEFIRVITLLDELALTDESAKDLRILAAGFRDLCERLAKQPKVAGAEPPSPTEA
jgi:tetratricopeptide (TPR) repeat protein